ncbi:MAG: imidazolonepropionase [Prevotella sp.]|nr:imidazolonepropionase [Prevotella sp.]MBR7053414.1 imidazolonepropionase [Prevotella sp.]
MKTLIHNIGMLAGIHPVETRRLQGGEMGEMGVIDDAWLLIDDDRIASFGKMKDIGKLSIGEETAIDVEGGTVLPCWCDPHTHLVYPGSREGEFVDKIRGLSYAEIARRGGGILNSADRLHAMSEDELFSDSMQRLEELVATGTGCVEIKSGYGLNTADELKMLRVVKRLQQSSPLKIVSTFLGAHAVGRNYAGRQGDYVDLVIDEMIPAVAKEGLADYVDVFCDDGFFTPEETERILLAGARHGMRPKIHACELASSGGVRVGVEHLALSIDHLENASDEDLQMLAGTGTMATLLPGTSFFLNMPYARARHMIDCGLGIALASDCNPGSTPSSDMKFVVSLACIKMRLTPVEAINAATLNAAYAMGLEKDYGSIAVGKKANLQILNPIPSLDYIPYAYTRRLVKRMVLEGRMI